MKATKENIQILNKLGFYNNEENDLEFYCDKIGWGFYINELPNFQALLSKLAKYNYRCGIEDAIEESIKKIENIKYAS